MKSTGKSRVKLTLTKFWISLKLVKKYKQLMFELTLVTSPNADLFLVGALFGDSSAILLHLSSDFPRSEVIVFEFAVLSFVILSWNQIFQMSYYCLIAYVDLNRRHSWANAILFASHVHTLQFFWLTERENLCDLIILQGKNLHQREREKFYNWKIIITSKLLNILSNTNSAIECLPEFVLAGI